jgi:hypothetical protein
LCISTPEISNCRIAVTVSPTAISDAHKKTAP